MKQLLCGFLILTGIAAHSQSTFTRKDSLHGGLRPERTSYDVQRYDLNIRIDPEKKFISGYNDITFKVVEPTAKIQVDLFENMQVDSIIFNRSQLQYSREFGAVFISMPLELASGTEHQIRFYYSGNPVAAKNAPWDGGFVWQKDQNGKPWIGVAVQGTGASLWYPVKDSQSDEPERGASVKVAVPDGVMNVSNGRLLGSEKLADGYTRWDWEVRNPINNYDITVNIGDYVNIHDTHNGMDLDYWVLRDNEAKARSHFRDVKPMLTCFESKFGKYPFADDSFKLVESPYLGMEHQSAIAYGNKYRKGYLGSDLSGTGIGLRFDYIVIHEAGHEWFGNSVTSKDIADMWIHEGFTTYTESVFVECLYGYDDAMRYINGQKFQISNDRPIIGHYGVNKEGSGDMYYKGTLLLNTLRHIVNDDAKWWRMLFKFAESNRHKIITTEDVVNFFNTESGIDLTPVFNQYLRTSKIPELSIRIDGKKFIYQWLQTNADFNMPVDIKIASKEIRLFPTTSPQEYKVGKIKADDMEVMDEEFLIFVTKS